MIIFILKVISKNTGTVGWGQKSVPLYQAQSFSHKLLMSRNQAIFKFDETIVNIAQADRSDSTKYGADAVSV